MTTQDRNPLPQDPDGLPDALRWQLRGLRREAMPERDLWAGISARIAAEPVAAQAAPAAANAIALPPRPLRKLAWLAMAASVALAVGLVWQLRPAGTVASSEESETFASAAPHADPTTAILISREASAMTWEYKAALREIDAHNRPAAEPAALRQLDRSAAEVRSALAQNPDARFLLDRLQKLYAQRLALTQRLALS